MSSYHPGADYFLKRAMFFEIITLFFMNILNTYVHVRRATIMNRGFRKRRALCALITTPLCFTYFFFAVAANRFFVSPLENNIRSTIGRRRRVVAIVVNGVNYKFAVPDFTAIYIYVYITVRHTAGESISAKNNCRENRWHTTCARGRKREKKIYRSQQ